MHRFILTMSLAVLASGCSDREEETATSQPEEIAAQSASPDPVSPPQSDLMLEQLWVAEGFAEPEGATLSADGGYYFISNVNGSGDDADGNGFISRLGTDGEILDLVWVEGLDAPKGMAVHDGHLFVSNITDLAIINIERGTLDDEIAVPDSVFLNDVTYVNGLGILISDSGTARIYQYQDNEVSVWLESEQLDGINGVLGHDGQVLVVAMTDGELLSIDPETKEISVIAGGMDRADMMAPLDNGGYLVSSWPGMIHYVTPQGERQTVQDTMALPIYMNDFTLTGDTMVIPNWQPGTVRAYRVSLPD